MNHPGVILHVDGATGQVMKRVSVEQVPEARRFLAGVPVVKVIIRRGAGRTSIAELGPNGQLLRTTVS